jgi:hypothetical protein
MPYIHTYTLLYICIYTPTHSGVYVCMYVYALVCVRNNVSYTWNLLNEVRQKNIGLYTCVKATYTSVCEILSGYQSYQLVKKLRTCRGPSLPLSSGSDVAWGQR